MVVMLVLVNNKFVVTLPIPPTVNNYLIYKVGWKNGKAYVKVDKNKQSTEFEYWAKVAIEEAIKKQGWVTPPKNQFIIVEAVTFKHRANLDSNNLWKLPLDVLEACGVYENDSRVLERTKRVYVDSKNPRMELTIYTKEDYGIFETAGELNRFIEKYESCMKNFSNSGLMKEARIGKIHKDVSYYFEDEKYHFYIPKYDKKLGI